MSKIKRKNNTLKKRKKQTNKKVSKKQNKPSIDGGSKKIEPLEEIRSNARIILSFPTIIYLPSTSVFDDMWLKEYTTALIKQQWGSNLIKFEGMQLPGGVQLNGRQIYDDATNEIVALRERIRVEHELPPDFFVG